MAWEYTREETTRIEVGDHRVEIVDVKETVSKAGNQMIVVTVKPNGSDIKIQHYIVRNERFNRNMTEFFDAFPQIQEGDFNFLVWVGCVGAARLKKDENDYLKVAWFISEKKAEKLPPWVGEMPERQTVTSLPSDGDSRYEKVDLEEDFPF